MFSIFLNVPFCQSEIDKKYFVVCFVKSYAEVIRFDISVKKMAVMNILDATDHLVQYHQNCFQGEFAESILEKTLE